MDYVTKEEDKVSWSRSLKQRAARREKAQYDEESIILTMYRPFTKKYLYRNRFMNENERKTYLTMPNNHVKNLYLNISGSGSKLPFDCLISNVLMDMHALYTSRTLPRYTYPEKNKSIIKQGNIKSDEEFFYIYGILYSKEFRERYANDLKKSFPRIPNVKNKEKYIEVGRKLADLHLNYESVPPYEEVEVIYKTSNPSYKVTKMKHPRRGVLDTIVFNHDITITNIPEKAYEYIVNGKSAIEWIINQYQVKTDKKSCIMDDPNLYSENEKYIFNLLLSIINVSVQTVDLVNSLPPLEIEE